MASGRGTTPPRRARAPFRLKISHRHHLLSPRRLHSLNVRLSSKIAVSSTWWCKEFWIASEFIPRSNGVTLLAGDWGPSEFGRGSASLVRPKERAEVGMIRSVIAMLGRRDTPVDGVEDYCTFLSEGLARRGVEMTRVRVNWTEQGWLGALRQLRRDSKEWREHWVLLQYTALGWSRHGFPIWAVIVL